MYDLSFWVYVFALAKINPITALGHLQKNLLSKYIFADRLKSLGKLKILDNLVLHARKHRKKKNKSKIIVDLILEPTKCMKINGQKIMSALILYFMDWYWSIQHWQKSLFIDPNFLSILISTFFYVLFEFTQKFWSITRFLCYKNWRNSESYEQNY